MTKKNILIIGSDSGIASKLIKNILDNSENLTTVSRKKNISYNKGNHFCVDLSKSQEIFNFIKKIELIKFDTFIYLPGIFNPKEITQNTYEEIINEINVNLTAAILISRAILPNMINEKKGTLLFVGSSSSYFGFKRTSIYCSSKHGILGFTRSLSEELREKNIKVSCISPGSVNTKMSVPLHADQNPDTFIDPLEISELLTKLIYEESETMWQEEIILKRRKY